MRKVNERESKPARVELGGRFAAVLESASNGMMFLTSGGKEMYRNPAMTRLMARDPQSSDIASAVRLAARQLHRDTGNGNRIPVRAIVHTSCDDYTVRAHSIGRISGQGRHSETLVTVSRTSAFLATPEELIQRFGLTKREAEVARLLAERKSDLEISAQLGISWHTARHHVERVFGCLAVRTRSAVRELVIAESTRIND